MIDSGFWRGKRVLVTGHTGFKGGWLTLLLDALGAQVAGYADGVPTTPSLFESANVKQCLSADYRHDIRDLDQLTSSFKDFSPEIVFHLAAQPLVRAAYAAPVDTFAINVMGAVNCLEAVRALPSLRCAVIATSDKVYANQNWDFGYRETDSLGGADPYSASKACAELVTAAYRQSFGLDGHPVVASVRAGNVIGGGDFSADRLVPDLFRAVQTRQKLVLRYPSGIRPWQHVFDPLLGYLQLAEALAEGSAGDTGWNFGPSSVQSVTVGQFVEHFVESWCAPLSVEISDIVQPKETGTLRLDSTKAAIKLGWRPVVSFQDMLALTTRWYRTFMDGGDIADLSRTQVTEVLIASAKATSING